jgi:DNA-binding NtrC family response regulator
MIAFAPMSTGSAPTVLVLDDEAGVRDALTQFLQSCGYRSVEAGSVDEATAILREQSVGAVLLDVRVSGAQTGLAVLTSLREQPWLAEIPVLILAGEVTTDSQERFIANNRAHLFRQPQEFDTLRKFLDRLTGRGPVH